MFASKGDVVGSVFATAVAAGLGRRRPPVTRERCWQRPAARRCRCHRAAHCDASGRPVVWLPADDFRVRPPGAAMRRSSASVPRWSAAAPRRTRQHRSTQDTANKTGAAHVLPRDQPDTRITRPRSPRAPTQIEPRIDAACSRHARHALSALPLHLRPDALHDFSESREAILGRSACSWRGMVVPEPCRSPKCLWRGASARRHVNVGNRRADTQRRHNTVIVDAIAPSDRSCSQATNRLRSQCRAVRRTAHWHHPANQHRSPSSNRCRGSHPLAVLLRTCSDQPAAYMHCLKICVRALALASYGTLSGRVN